MTENKPLYGMFDWPLDSKTYVILRSSFRIILIIILLRSGAWPGICIGGLFRKSKFTFQLFSLGIRTVLCPKLGEDQKKGLHPGWDRFL